MRRLVLTLLLLWLPLHWSWAATVAFRGHAASAAEHAAHAMVIESTVEGHPADAAHAADAAGEHDEDCSLCQAADWQAALSSMPPFAPIGEMPPPFADAPPFESFVPPVPKPPARPHAA
jgi:hypothetical protein